MPRARVVALVGLMLTAHHSTAAAAGRGLLVRVYDQAGVPAQELAVAIATGHGILAAAGVESEWVHCSATPSAEHAPALAERPKTVCDSTRTQNDVVIRLTSASRSSSADTSAERSTK